jgi:hypothetical protein
MKPVICRLLVALMIWAPFQLAHAGAIGTDTAIASSAQLDRAALAGFIARADVASQLQSLGVDPASARARIAALSDEEARTLAAQAQSLPAGGNALGLFLLVVAIGAAWWFFTH